MKGWPKRKKAALCGCGLLENVADLVIQRCRRTRRDPSSSTERRRKMARRLVRFRIMAQGHTAEGLMMSSGLEPGRDLVGTDGEDVRFMPEVVTVDNRVPVSRRKLIYYASEQ